MDVPSCTRPQMQRCPYIHEMRERLITETPRQVHIMNRIDRERDRVEREGLLSPKQSSAISDASSNQVGTVVKVCYGNSSRIKHVIFNLDLALCWSRRKL